jgi:hypothetical protein
MLAHAPLTQGGDTSKRSPLDIGDILRTHRDAFTDTHVLSSEQRAVLHAISRCRTAALGGHADVCDSCGYTEVSYNSCRDRHCPKCQALAQARWVEQRMERVLPTHSFHVVFTLPEQLRALALVNRALIFDMLFACATETLLELGRDPRRLGAELGITSVLHTWTRELLFHPHLHCIVTGGGLSLDGERWVSTRPNFLLPVRVMGKLFRGKLLARLRDAYWASKLRLDGTAASLADTRRFLRLCAKLRKKRWVVYAKPPFGGPENVFRYLGRYTHRVGISNQRLVSHDDRGVTFRTRGANTVTVAPGEFIRRFLLHVLPKGFVKIRHHGLMAPSNIATKLAAARRLLEAASTTPTPVPTGAARTVADLCAIVLALALAAFHDRSCPCCPTGMLIQHLFDPDRGPTTAPTDTS